MKNDTNLTMEQIEELEHAYLMKYWYFLKFVEDEIIKGFKTKDDILNDWKGLYGGDGGNISDFAVGSERIIYALLNGKAAGQPNSCPVSADLFFEVEDAYIHIDLKSVTTTDGSNEINPETGKKYTDNIGDYNTSVFIGENQNSYKGYMLVNEGKPNEQRREYTPNIPPIYHKKNGENKIALTYFVTILNNQLTMETEMISIMCMPNGKLEPHYKNRPLKAGKNPGKTRFNFKNVSTFELLNGDKKRVRVIYTNPNMPINTKKRLKFYFDNFIPKVDE